MSKKKSFTTAALSTITGGDQPKAPETAPKKRTPAAKKKPTTPPQSMSSVQPIVSRNTTRTGKPVTLYLNTVNYQLFKQKVKEDGKAASTVLNEMIAEYLS